MININEPNYKNSKKEFKKKYFVKILEKNRGNISNAAHEAGIDRRTIHRSILKFNINIDKIRKETDRFLGGSKC